MFITALCPTFRHPALLANSLALWLGQDYPLEKRRMIILDDQPTFDDQSGPGWELLATANRLPTISAKYNLMLEKAPPQTDVFLVWEDDDIYFLKYVSSHAAAMAGGAELSKSDMVLTDYPGSMTQKKIIKEGARGRFHSSLSIHKNLMATVGGWPDTKRADFDQQLMSLLHEHANEVVKPWEDDVDELLMHFLYRWHSGAAHCQSTMRSPDDETWYDEALVSYKEVPFVGPLVPKLDGFTVGILADHGERLEAYEA